LQDIFDLRDEITETAVGAIEPEVAQAELDRTKAKRPENRDAWGLCLRARAQVYLFTHEALEEAASLCRRAIERESNLARAHSTLALAYQRQLLLNYAKDRKVVRQSVRRTAQRAVALDREDAVGHTVLGLALWKAGEADEAMSVLNTAMALNPSHAFAQSTVGLALGTSSDPERAMEFHDTAIRLSPRDPQPAIFLSRHANAYINMGRYEKAVDLAKRAIRRSGGNLWLNFVEGANVLAQLNRLEEARDMVRRMKSIHLDALVQAVRRAFPFADPAADKHYMNGLRLAGLNED